MAARAVHSKNHMTQETEKTTKGTLQVLFLCTIKRVVFIDDISNTKNTFSYRTPAVAASVMRFVYETGPFHKNENGLIFS